MVVVVVMVVVMVVVVVPAVVVWVRVGMLVVAMEGMMVVVGWRW